MLTDVQLGWLAGIVDGEGCIWSEWSNSKRQVGGSLCILVQIEACSDVMIMRCASLISELGVEFFLSKPKLRSNTMRTWRSSRQLIIKKRSEALKFLEIIRDHLVVKRPEADVALEYLRKWGDQRGHAPKAPTEEKILVFEELRRLKRIA